MLLVFGMNETVEPQIQREKCLVWYTLTHGLNIYVHSAADYKNKSHPAPWKPLPTSSLLCIFWKTPEPAISDPCLQDDVDPSLYWDIIGELGDGAFGKVWKCKLIKLIN